MFFIKLESPSGNFSPSYKVLDVSQEEAIKQYNQAFSPFLAGQADAKLKISLLEAGEEMGQETVLREMYCTTVRLPDGWETTYTHPQDYTIWHEGALPDGLLEALRPLLLLEQVSFPNGSNYVREYLPIGSYSVEGLGNVSISTGYKVRVGKWDVYSISNATYDSPGVDLGMHFNTCDKYLVAFKQ